MNKEQLGQFVVPPIVLMLNDLNEEKRIIALQVNIFPFNYWILLSVPGSNCVSPGTWAERAISVYERAFSGTGRSLAAGACPMPAPTAPHLKGRFTAVLQKEDRTVLLRDEHQSAPGDQGGSLRGCHWNRIHLWQ